MRGKDYVKKLITERKKGKQHSLSEFKGLSKEELREYIDETVPGNTAIKAAVFGLMADAI